MVARTSDRKRKNAIDLETKIIVAARVYHGDEGDAQTVEDTQLTTPIALNEAGTGREVEDVVADKGDHSEDSLDRLHK